MEEWQYLEEHRDLYKDVMMENSQPLTSPGKDGMIDSHGHLYLSSHHEEEDSNITQANSITPNVPSVLHSGDISTDTVGHKKPSANQSLTFKQITGHRWGKIFLRGKHFKKKSNLLVHEKNHIEKGTFSCTECGKSFTRKLLLVRHQRTHKVDKPYTCSECGKCFMWKGSLEKHQRDHTGEKSFSCSKMGDALPRNQILWDIYAVTQGKGYFHVQNVENVLTMNQTFIREPQGESPMKDEELPVEEDEVKDDNHDT
ncbi:zinc finger protein 432-like [Bufo gargarizans]|uniref:zinc finger protein 432-like n=1 Tax=Bufo gargarizans TaxID=30331 RepID=UPI001CF4F5CE|nr:zinc finger protein 432-like [Bufo gargarizans]